MKKFYIILGPALLLTGCAETMPPLNFSPPNVGLSRVQQDAALVSTFVTGVQNPIASMWQTTLDESILRMAIFRDASPNKLSLSVRVIELEIPEIGFDMTVHTIARYELINRDTGDIVFSTDVEAVGEATVSENFSGSIRRINALNRAVQNNIGSFLQKLESADLSNPMFPSQQQVEQN